MSYPMGLLLLHNTVHSVDLNYVLDMGYYTCYFNTWDVLSVTVNYFIGFSFSAWHPFGDWCHTCKKLEICSRV